MSVAKVQRQSVSPQYVQDLAARVNRLERQGEMILVDLEDRGSTNVWLVLIVAYFLAGIYIGREFYKQHDGKKRRE